MQNSKNNFLIILAMGMLVLLSAACLAGGVFDTEGHLIIPKANKTQLAAREADVASRIAATQTSIAETSIAAYAKFAEERETQIADNIAGYPQWADWFLLMQTPTPTSTQVDANEAAPTSSFPIVSVSTDTNCRIGPGQVYQLKGALLVGEKADIVARDPSGYFWYIENPDKPGEFCWLWGNYAAIEGDTSKLPVFTPIPPPTFTPTATSTPTHYPTDTPYPTVMATP